MFQNFVFAHSGKPLSKETQLVLNVLDSITDGFFFVDDNWTVLYWNRSAEKIMSVPAQQIVGQNIWDFYSDAKEMEFYTQYHYSKEHKVAVEFETYYPTQNLWLEVKTYPYSQGLAVYFKDITTKKLLAEEVTKTRLQQDALISATEDLIWSVDKNLKLVVANRAFQQLVKEITGSEVMPGTSILDIKHGDRKMLPVHDYHRTLAGEAQTVVYTILVNGAFQHHEVRLQPIINQQTEEILGVAGYSRNVTSNKKHQEEIEKSNSILREKEQRLQELTNKLETVFHSSLDMICTADYEGRFTNMSRASKQILGYDPEELIGRRYIELLHPDDTAKTLDLVSHLLEGGKVTSFRNRMIKRSGQIAYILWSSHWDDKQQLMFSVGRDASTLVQAEMLKEATEKKLTALIQKGGDLVAILDEAAKYQYISGNVEKVLGYNESDLIGKSAFTFISEEDLPAIKKNLSELMDDGEMKKAEVRFNHKDGSSRCLELVGTNLLQDPAVQGIVINARDITERKLYAEQLKAVNDRFEIVMKATNEVIWDYDFAAKKLVWNDNYTALLGYSKHEDDTLLKWKEKIHEEERERVWKSMIEVFVHPSKNYWKAEYRYRKADGSYAYIFDQGYTIKNHQKYPIRFVGAMIDLTERKKIEDERELIIEELTSSNNDLKQFSFITSHNLRAPLSNILGILNMLDVETFTETNKQLIYLLQSSARQLQETIKDLSDIIVIRNKAGLENEMINLEKVFENVKRIYLNTLQDVPLELLVDFQVKEVFINKAYLESIFINLVSNAIKYRSPKRPLVIQISTSLCGNNRFLLHFCDNGIGLDTKRLESRLFGLYQRFHDHTDGKGLGLFIVKSQVGALGGTIQMEGEEDRGLSFNITLPLRRELDGA